MADKPKIVTLCGSSRFVEVIAVCAWLIERDEGAITMSIHLLPRWYCKPDHHLAEAQGVAEAMDALHLKKIDLADEIFVVDVCGYIGESTEREIAHAAAQGIPVRRFTEDSLGHRWPGMYSDGVVLADGAPPIPIPRPIETAPRDGTPIILLTSDFGWVEGRWDDTVANFYKSQKNFKSYDPENARGDWVSMWFIGAPEDAHDRRLFCGCTPHFWMPRPDDPEGL